MASMDQLEQFAKTISREPFGIAQYAPEPLGLQPVCFVNVAQKVERDGGNAIYAWMFNLKVSTLGEYFVAIHHAVWRSKTGHLIDVTPYDEDRQHHPLSQDGGTLIVVDQRSKPVQTPRIRFGALPSKFFAIDNSPELREYVEKLQREEVESCNNLYALLEASETAW